MSKTDNSAAENPKQKRKGLPDHLTPGNPGNSGGKPGRSGRKPSKWIEDCEKALEGSNAPEVLKAIIAGDIQEHIGDDRKTGEPIYGETRNTDRIGAIKFLASYVHGEPEQKIAATVTFKAVKE